MIQRTLPDDRRPPLTPQLAVRVTVIGGFALAMFAIILFRLWFLQVLSGSQYAKAAQRNRTATVVVLAPRGEIVDRNGAVLVRSRQTTAVEIVPTQLPVPVRSPTIGELAKPAASDRSVYRRLASVLGIPTTRQKCKVVGTNQQGQTVTHHLRLAQIACDVAQAVYQLPYSNARIATDVKPDVLFYLRERHAQFPGVDEPQVSLTSYPQGGLAAQVLGTVGPITATEVNHAPFTGLPPNSIVGQTGLEYYYDRYLRGVDGANKIEVDASGNPIQVLPQTAAGAGNTLKTSLDLGLQQAGQASLAQSMSTNTPGGAGGAFVAMNPQNGQVYAMGSLPTYDPNIFTKPVTQSVYNSLVSPTSGAPLDNRAVAGLYPTGSTFKPITATAALESGVWGLNQTYDDTGQYCFPQTTLCLHNAGGVANGVLNLVSALKVSDDIFFYNLGAKLNAFPLSHPRGGALQQWARLFGIGHTTGIDLPYEARGNLPDPAWRAAINKLEFQCDTATGPFTGKAKHAPGGCGIADGTNRPWTEGDNVNLAVGQGDVLVTPLQLAVAYSAIANGGTIVRPHIGLQVENNIGDQVLQNIDLAPAHHIHINPTYLDTIRQGLRDAASAPGGTSADVMGNFPMPVYGKTGTAEHVGQPDQAWYACYVPATATTKPIAVVVTVEKGGFGAVAAAPVARQILSQWFFGKPGAYVAGKSPTL